MRITALNKIGLIAGTLALAFTLAHPPQASAQTADSSLADATTASTTSMFSNVTATMMGSSSAMISWTTDASSSSQVAYGTSTSYSTYSELFPALVGNHMVGLYGLMPDTLYHFQLISTGSDNMTAMSGDYTFSTGSSTDTTGTTTDQDNNDDNDADDNDNDTDTDGDNNTSEEISSLQQSIQDLYDQLDSLSARLQALINGIGGSNGGGNGTTTPPVTTTAMINPANATMSAGSSVDFNGRGFGREETVTIMRNGVAIGSAHADGGGNFSTGSMSIPTNATGTLTYTFTGQWSNNVGTATIHIQ